MQAPAATCVPEAVCRDGGAGPVATDLRRPVGPQQDLIGAEVGDGSTRGAVAQQLANHRQQDRCGTTGRKRGVGSDQGRQRACPWGLVHATGVTRKPRYMAITANTEATAPPPASSTLLPRAF